jgi:hypothetical protein
MFRRLLLVAAFLGLSAPIAKAEGPAFTQVKVWVYTDDDDKDKEESVTFRVKHIASGKIIGEVTVGQGEVWDDKTARTITIDLKEGLPQNAASDYGLEIEKSRHKHKNGYGWDFHAKAWGILPGNIEVEVLKQQHAYLGRGHGMDNEPIVYWPFGK